MYSPSEILARKLAAIAQARRNSRPVARALAKDRTLQTLVADLVASRTAMGMTQHEVAIRMATSKSVVSRLESGLFTRPTLNTIEKYALAVGAQVEIQVRAWR